MQIFGKPMAGLAHREGQGEETADTHSLDEVVLDEAEC